MNTEQIRARIAKEPPPFERYSFDFTGADELLVFAKDFEQPGEPETFGHIGDAATVARVITLLKALPTQGEMQKKMVPHLVIQVIAYQGGKQLAFIEFHRHYLKGENTAMLVLDEPQQTTLQELRALVDAALGTPR